MAVNLLGFDWSGTLSDDRLPVYEVDRRLMEAVGREFMPYEKWLSHTTYSAPEMLRFLGFQGNDQELMEIFRKEYQQVLESGIIPVHYPDASAVVDYFSQAMYAMFILSTHPEDFVKKEADGMCHYFSDICGSCPDKAKSLLKMMERYGKNPEDTAYVGDMQNDMIAAKKAGAAAIGITTGYHSRNMLKEAGADYIVDSLSELENIPIFQRVPENEE